MRQMRLFALLFWGAALPACATTYWVAPNGDDANAGISSNAPFATPQKAVSVSLAPGDTIYVRGGTYALSAKIAPGSSKVGAAGNPIKFWAYPGEFPVFDFATMPESSDKGLDIRRNYWHVKGIEVKNAPDSGIFVGGLGVIIEGCVVHDCDNDGLVIGSSSVRGTNALILNCDSYRNYQVGSGGNNGDGFAAKVGNGAGNVFRHCRAWDNADDGWDFYDNTNSVAIDGCWSFHNGFDLWGVGAGWSGNGNGFKLGGEGTPAEHVLTNCVAFGNRSKGFDHNNGDAGQTMVNCTSYNNGGANYSFYEIPTKGPRLYNLLINCVSFTGTLTNLAANTIMFSNSWQGATVNAADFVSLDTSVATNARAANYELVPNQLLRLAAGSDLMDRGLNIGLPFNGSAPDLGAFEFLPVVTQGPITLSNSQWSPGGFRFQVNGLTSHGPVVIYSSTNSGSWTPLLTNPPVTGSLPVTDPGGPSHVMRFYRAEEK